MKRQFILLVASAALLASCGGNNNSSSSSAAASATSDAGKTTSQATSEATKTSEDLPPVGTSEDLPPVGTSEDLPPVEESSEDLPPVEESSENLPPVKESSEEPVEEKEQITSLDADGVAALWGELKKTANATVQAVANDHITLGLNVSADTDISTWSENVWYNYPNDDYKAEPTEDRSKGIVTNVVVDNSSFDLSVGLGGYANLPLETLLSSPMAAVMYPGVHANASMKNIDLDVLVRGEASGSSEAPVYADWEVASEEGLELYYQDYGIFAKYDTELVDWVSTNILRMFLGDGASMITNILDASGKISCFPFGVPNGGVEAALRAADESLSEEAPMTVANFLSAFDLNYYIGSDENILSMITPYVTGLEDLTKYATIYQTKSDESAFGLEVSVNMENLKEIAYLGASMSGAAEGAEQAIEESFKNFNALDISIHLETDENYVLTGFGISNLNIDLKEGLSYGGTHASYGNYCVTDDQTGDEYCYSYVESSSTNYVKGRANIGLEITLDTESEVKALSPEEKATYVDKTQEIMALISGGSGEQTSAVREEQ